MTRPTTSPCTRQAPSRASADATFYTIGHATRPLEDFVALLREASVVAVADVRSMPRSRTNPQYNSDTFAPALAEHRIDYLHIAELGGLRPRQRHVPPERNAFWRNTSFHKYADYALSEDFHRGLERLRAFANGSHCAILCAETLWWRCHRRIIADYLLAEHKTVFHIIDPGQIVPATMTEAARPAGLEGLVYPAASKRRNKQARSPVAHRRIALRKDPCGADCPPSSGTQRGEHRCLRSQRTDDPGDCHGKSS